LTLIKRLLDSIKQALGILSIVILTVAANETADRATLDPGGETTVDHDIGASDEGRFVRGEEKRQVCDLFWPTHPTQRDFRNQLTHGMIRIRECMTHVREAVEQLRGVAINQVKGVEIALVTGGPAALPVSGTLLRRS
jgi:hypothetical protein